METRLVIAYALMAFIVLAVVAVLFWKARERRIHREQIRGRQRYARKSGRR